jgi:broad specificity phosphatase PhoE
MRQIYSSPRPESIDRVVALLKENGIETTVTNRSVWKRPGYERFSYSQRMDDRSQWPQVWIKSADDFTRSRALLREIGVEPVTRYSEELAQSRQASTQPPAQRTAARVRLIVLTAVAAVCLMVMLKAMQVL